MTNFYIAISFCLLVPFILLELRHFLHILQLSHYDNKRFLKYIKDKYVNAQYFIEMSLLLIYFILLLILFEKIKFVIPFLIIVAGYLIFRLPPLKQKKPIVYTYRVKRLIVTTFVVISLSTLLLIFLFKDFSLTSKTTVLFGYFTMLSKVGFITVLLANIINYHIEKWIQKKYIDDAKQIVNSINDLNVVGITGSYGKTSTKFFLAKVLETEKTVCKTPKSYNTPMGITKTIREQLKAYDDVFIAEMGAFKTGEILELCEIANPKHGILTEVGPQHLETFKTIDNVLNTKFELINYLPKDGIGVINIDNELIREYYENNSFKAKIVTFGIKQESDYKVTNYKYSPKGTEFTVRFKDNSIYSFTTKLLGKHNLYNLVSVIALATQMGISKTSIASAIKQIVPVNHRLEIKRSFGVTLIDDSFNANPKGTKNALEVLSQFNGVKVVVTPGMVDLGEMQYDLNEQYGVQIADVCDKVILVGEKQAIPIYSGLLAKKFDIDNITEVSDVSQSFEIIKNLKKQVDDDIIVLLANDLPDNFL